MLIGTYSTKQLGVLSGSIIPAIGGLVLGGSAFSLAIRESEQ